MKTKQQGFTLVELIIAIVLMSMMSLILLSSFNQGIRTWEAVELQSRKMAEKRLVWRFLNQTINEAVMITETIDFKRKSMFSGTDNSFEFVAPVAKRAGIGGLSIIHIGLADVEDKKDLVINRWLYHPEVIKGKVTERRWRSLQFSNRLEYHDDIKGSDYGEHLLAENIETLQIEYLSAKKDADWQTEWTKKKPPILIKIKIKKNDQWWEDFVFKISGNSAVQDIFGGSGGFNFR